MKEYVIYWVYRFGNILLAPFYFHFGHHWLFIEIMTTLADMVDGTGLFYLMFYILIGVCIARNATFQAFVKNLYKNYLQPINLLPLSVYISIFYMNFLDLVSFLFDKISNFFKSKK